MKLQFIGLVPLAFLISSCAQAVKSYDENGKAEVRIDCSWEPMGKMTMNDCYKKALEECPNGYFKVADSDGAPSSGANGNNNVVNNLSIGSRMRTAQFLTIRCK